MSYFDDMNWVDACRRENKARQKLRRVSLLPRALWVLAVLTLLLSVGMMLQTDNRNYSKINSPVVAEGRATR
jgi:hypothetical protein